MSDANTVYCLDYSALVNIDRHYPESDFPGVWETLSGMAVKGTAIAPAEISCQLARDDKADGTLLAWAQTNPALFHEADSHSVALCDEIAGRYRGAFPPSDPDGTLDAIALAVAHRESRANHDPGYALVTFKPITPKRPDYVDACEDPDYALDVQVPVRMLREIGLDVPAPPGSAIDYYGIWKGFDLTFEEIAAYKFKGGPARQ